MPDSLIYYQVTVNWPSPSGTFIIACQKQSSTLFYFAESDLNLPLARIDFSKEEPVPRFLNFHPKVIALAAVRIYRAMQENQLSDSIGHHNCAISFDLTRLNQHVAFDE